MTESNTSQMQRILEDAGQFFSGVDIISPTVLATDTARDGDSTALDEVEKLILMGNTEGRRFLSRVTNERRAQIEIEPRPGTKDWAIDADGLLYDPFGAKVPHWMAPAGMWLTLKNVIPASVNFARIAEPAPVFIERCEVNVPAGRMILEPRGIPSVFDIGG